MLDRSKAPEYIIPEHIELIHPIRRTLQNGVPLYFIHTPELEVVKVEVVMPCDHSIFTQERGLIPFFTLNMLLEGTHDMSSESLDDFFDYYATEVEIISGYEQQGLSLLTTKKHFREVLPVFRSLFTEATFPEKELNKRKSQKKLTIGIQREQTSARANQLIRRVLFGENHPFGYISSEEHADSTHSDAIKHYYKNHFCISPEIFVSGNFGDREIVEIEREFAAFPFSSTYQPASSFANYPEKRVIETRPNALQSSIRLGKILIPKSHPDFFATTVFNTALGGYFGSRLIKNIREEKGYTYGIYSFISSLKTTDYWMIIADIKEGATEATLEEVYKEIKTLSETPMDKEEVETLRNYMIGSFLSQFSSPFDQMDKFKKVHLQNLGYEFYEKQLDYIKKFAPEDIMAVGATHFDPRKIKEVLVGTLDAGVETIEEGNVKP